MRFQNRSMKMTVKANRAKKKATFISPDMFIFSCAPLAAPMTTGWMERNRRMAMKVMGALNPPSRA